MSVVGRMMGYGRDENYDRAIRLFDTGDYRSAIEGFTQVLARSNDEAVLRLSRFYCAEAHAQLGNSAIQHGELQAAADEYEKALSIQPTFPDIRWSLARVNRKMGRWEVAADHLREALAINPRFAKAILEQAILAYQTGDREGGLKRAEQALSLDPPLRTPGFERALEYHAKGEFDKVVTVLEALPDAPNAALEHGRIADDLYKRGLYKRAAEEYEKALTLQPRYADIRCHYGLALHALGRTAQSIEQYNVALDINPKYVEARLHLAVTYRDSDQPGEAEREFRRVLELDPDNIIARNNVRT